MTEKATRQEEQAALVERACELPGVAAVLAVYGKALRVQPPVAPVPRVRYSTDSNTAGR